MTTVIDLSDFSGFDAEDSFTSTELIVKRESDTVVSIESLTTTNSFLKQPLPGPYPVGAKVTLIADVRTVSGQGMYMSLDSYNDSSYGDASHSAGKTVESSVSCVSDGEFTEFKLNAYVKPGNQFFRIVLGYFSGRIGKADVRAVRVLIDGADISTAKPVQTNPISYGRVFSIDEINREWSAHVTGAGVITRHADKIAISSDIPGRAYLRYALSDTFTNRNKNELYDIEGTKGFTVSLKATRRGGLPAVYVDYMEALTNTVVAVGHGFFIGNDGAWQVFWFPPMPAAARAHLGIGFFTSNDGDFDLEGLKVAQYGSIRPSEPSSFQHISATLIKEGGEWVVWNDSVGKAAIRGSSSIIKSVSEVSGDLEVLFHENAVKGYNPVILANVNGNLDRSEKFYASIFGSSVDKTSIRFHDVTTGDHVVTGVVDGGTMVDIVGMCVR